jgi:hypothetical protein
MYDVDCVHNCLHFHYPPPSHPEFRDLANTFEKEYVKPLFCNQVIIALEEPFTLVHMSSSAAKCDSFERDRGYQQFLNTLMKLNVTAIM